METKSGKWTTSRSISSVLDANIPEAVSNITYTDDNVYLGVRYTELIPISIAAIQELGSKLQAAMDRITSLENQLASKLSLIHI